MIYRLICLLLVATPLFGFAQPKINTVKLSDNVISAAVDRPGDLYVTFRNGEIQHLDMDGNTVASLKGTDSPTLFDPRDGSRLFAFYRKARRYAYMNPSFEESKSLGVDSSFVADPWLVCPSGDHNLWAIDASDKTLKKINMTTSRIDAEVVLADITDLNTILFIREYQGFLFMHVRDKGILVFSGMGRQLKFIGDKQLSYFNFLGEELYYQEGNRMKFFNLFNAETRYVAAAGKAQFILLTDERMYAIDGRTLEVMSPMH